MCVDDCVPRPSKIIRYCRPYTIGTLMCAVVAVVVAALSGVVAQSVGLLTDCAVVCNRQPIFVVPDTLVRLIVTSRTPFPGNFVGSSKVSFSLFVMLPDENA